MRDIFKTFWIFGLVVLAALLIVTLFDQTMSSFADRADGPTESKARTENATPTNNGTTQVSEQTPSGSSPQESAD